MIGSCSQKSRILDLLRQRASLGLTALESLEQVGTMRLAAYVKFLKDDGHQIDTEIIRVPSGKRVARYRLITPTEGFSCSSSTSVSMPAEAATPASAAA